MENWDEIKRRLKIKIAAILDGKQLLTKKIPDQLLTRLEIRLGKSREAIMKMISEL